jgi:hypothetical protein
MVEQIRGRDLPLETTDHQINPWPQDESAITK